MKGKRLGCVFQHHGAWAFKVGVGKDGEGKYRYHREYGFPSRKAAEERMAEVVAKLKGGAYVEPVKMTLGEYLDRWLSLAKNNVTPKTLDGYELNVRLHIKPYLGAIPLHKLQPLHLQDLYTKLLEKGLSRRSVEYVHRNLHAALQGALRMGLVGRNVCDAVKPPKVERKEMLVLDEEEASRLVSGIEDLRLKAAVALAVGCGLRRGEICGLRWQDVDLDAGCIHVVQTVQRIDGQGLVTLPTKTHRSRRLVTLPPGLVAILKAWRKQQMQERLMAGPAWEETGFVLTTERGAPVDGNWITKNFSRKLKELGLPHIRFHDLRHSHATALLKKGVHPKVVQERLGHSAIGVTMDTYSHVLPGMQKEAAQAIDSIFVRASRNGGQV